MTGKPRSRQRIDPLPVREMNHTAAKANPNPINCDPLGGPSMNDPTTTGTPAATTADTGAATPICPIASERYNAINPSAPMTPATPANSNCPGYGSGSWVTIASMTNKIRLTSCEEMITR